MKRITYLLMLMFATVLINIGCEKENSTPATPVTPPVAQTLEQKYPDWKNLTWVSTQKIDHNTGVTYNGLINPRFYFVIVGDEVTETTYGSGGNQSIHKFQGIRTPSPTVIEFYNNDYSHYFNYEKTNSNTIVLYATNTAGNSNYTMRYTLKIN